MRQWIWTLLVLTGAGATAWGGATHTVTETNTLWDLSKHYYGTPFKWKVIADANTAVVEDPHWIYPGEVLVIPDAPETEPDLGPPLPSGVEASAPAAPPPPAPVPAPAEPAAPEPEAVHVQSDDLSIDLPPGMTGQYPSVSRFKFPKDWREDGRVASFGEGRIVAAQGDTIEVKLSGGVRAAVAEKFTVYRRDAVEELDAERDAVYLQKVGVAEVVNDMGGSSYRLLIRSSGDTIQVGDLLKRAP